MIYISLVLLIISIVFLIYCFKHSCYEFDFKVHISIATVVFTALISCFFIKTNAKDYWIKYKETVSVQELSISNFKLNVTSTTLTTPRKNEISYKIKGTNNGKTISINDSDINSISVSSSNKAINHLTKKKISYFNWATFLTTEKYEYVFSSK